MLWYVAQKQGGMWRARSHFDFVDFSHGGLLRSEVIMRKRWIAMAKGSSSAPAPSIEGDSEWEAISGLDEPVLSPTNSQCPAIEISSDDKSDTEEAKGKRAKVNVVDALEDSKERLASKPSAGSSFRDPLVPAAIKNTEFGQFKFPWEKGPLAKIFSSTSEPPVWVPKLQPGIGNLVSLDLKVAEKSKVETYARIMVGTVSDRSRIVNDVSFVWRNLCEILESHFAWQAQPRRKCICGGSTTSRPHLVWECPATLHLRVQIGRPSHRAEERLFAKVIPEMPAPPQEDNVGIMENYIQTLTTCIDESTTPLPLATDGSTTRSQVAAWGVYLPTAGQHFAGGVVQSRSCCHSSDIAGFDSRLQCQTTPCKEKTCHFDFGLSECVGPVQSLHWRHTTPCPPGLATDSTTAVRRCQIGVFVGPVAWKTCQRHVIYFGFHRG